MNINSPLPSSLNEECVKCAKILSKFTKPEDAKIHETIKQIPQDIIQNAKGIAIMTVVKAGFIWSGRFGSGLVVARTDNGQWSAPSAIYTAGAGIGWQVGAEFTDVVLVLNTVKAVESFYKPNVTVGGNLTVAAGPFGRSAEASGSVTGKLAAIYSYSKSKGLFAGISLEGSVIMERKDANEKFYGGSVSAQELLSGFVPNPEGAAVLYEALRLHS